MNEILRPKTALKARVTLRIAKADRIGITDRGSEFCFTLIGFLSPSPLLFYHSPRLELSSSQSFSILTTDCPTITSLWPYELALRDSVPTKSEEEEKEEAFLYIHASRWCAGGAGVIIVSCRPEALPLDALDSKAKGLEKSSRKKLRC